MGLASFMMSYISHESYESHSDGTERRF